MVIILSIEHIIMAKPLGIGIIIHLVAKPAWGEDLCLGPGAVELFFFAFACSGLEIDWPVAIKGLHGDLVFFCKAVVPVCICCPNYVLLCCSVAQKDWQNIL